jgi:hypothetical protein
MIREKYKDLVKSVDHQAVKAAIEANDYTAFLDAHPEEMRKDLTKEMFDRAKENES